MLNLLENETKQSEEEMQVDDFGGGNLEEDDGKVAQEEKTAEDDSGDQSLDHEEKTDRIPELIELTGQDGASVKLQRSCKRLVGTLENVLEGDESAEKMRVKGADQRSLDLVANYVTYHLSNEPKPTPLPILRTTKELKDVLADPWDASFLAPLSVPETINLTLVADFLNIEGLLDILRAYLVSRLHRCSDEDLLKIINTHEWANQGDIGFGGGDIAMSPEVGGAEDEICGLDDLLFEDEMVERQAPILLKPSDFLTLQDGKAHKNNSIIRLQELLKTNENSMFNSISSDFYQSAFNYSLYHPDLMVTRQELLICQLAQNSLVDDSHVLPIKQVDAETLKPVVKYLKHHEGREPAEIAKPIRSVKMEKIVEDLWDANFINSLSARQVFQLCLAANYLNIPSLLHLCCAKVATKIKGESPERIKEILGGQDNNDKPDGPEVPWDQATQ